MDSEALCTCGCPYRRHRPEIQRGGVVLACFRHDLCEGFTPAIEEESTLILAWDSWWCEICSARTWVEGARCHGELMTPVRMEMHSRESP